MTEPTHIAESVCRWCRCDGFHAEDCEGFEINDPARTVAARNAESVRRDLRVSAQELALEIVKNAPLEYQFGDPAEDAIAYVRALEAARIDG